MAEFSEHQTHRIEIGKGEEVSKWLDGLEREDQLIARFKNVVEANQTIEPEYRTSDADLVKEFNNKYKLEDDAKMSFAETLDKVFVVTHFLLLFCVQSFIKYPEEKILFYMKI